MDMQLSLKRKAFVEDPDAYLKIHRVLERLSEAGVLTTKDIGQIERHSNIQDEVDAMIDIVMGKGQAASSMLLDIWTDRPSYFIDYNPSETMAYTSTGLPPTSTDAVCNTMCNGKPHRGCKLPVLLDLRDPNEFKAMPVFDYLDLRSPEKQKRIMILVQNVLENMSHEDVKKFMRCYSSNLKHADSILRNPAKLSSVMLQYAHDNVHVYAERVYAMLKACGEQHLASSFKCDVFTQTVYD